MRMSSPNQPQAMQLSQDAAAAVPPAARAATMTQLSHREPASASTPPSSVSSSSSSAIRANGSVLVDSAFEMSAIVSPSVATSSLKRRQTESPEREAWEDCDTDVENEKRPHSQPATLRPSPVVDPDIARFPLSLFQSDNSDDAATSGQSASTISNGDRQGSAPSPEVQQQHEFFPQVEQREIRPIPAARRAGKQRALSPRQSRPPGSWGAGVGSSRSGGSGSSQASYDDLQDVNIDEKMLRVWPRDFIASVGQQLAWDAAHKPAQGIPASVVARGEKYVRKYSYFMQLRAYQNCRLLDSRWQDAFDSDDTIVRAFEHVTGLRRPSSDYPYPVENLQNALRRLCFACLLNDMDGDLRGYEKGFVILHTKRFGYINLCHLHCQTWAAASRGKNPSFLICDICLMEGSRNSCNHLDGKILTNQDLAVGDTALNTCESCRVDHFYDAWSLFPVTVPRKYREGLQATRAFSLFTAHGRGGAGVAAAEAHEELEQIWERQRERCECGICKRMKRVRKEEIRGLRGDVKRREERRTLRQ